MSDLRKLLEETGQVKSPLDEDVEIPPPPTTEQPASPPQEAPVEAPRIIQGGAPAKKAPTPRTSPAQPSDPNWRKVGYFRGHLDRLIQTGESMKVYFRHDDGKIAYVRSYSTKDLSQTNDIEEFLQRFLLPIVGEGTYVVSLVNSKGDETRGAEYLIMDPTKPKNGASPGDVAVGKTIDTLAALVQQIEKRTSEPKKPEPTILERMKEMESLMEMFGAKKGAMDPMQLMLLMEKMNPPRRDEGPSREMAEIKASLAELASTVKQQAMMARLPPPLPEPVAPPIDIPALIKGLAETMKPQTDLKELVQLMRPQETLGVKDILALLPTLKDLLGGGNGNSLQKLEEKIERMTQNPNRGLTDALKEWEVIQTLIDRNRPNAAEGESFWGFLNTLVTGLPSTVDSIGTMMSKIKSVESSEKRIPAESTTTRGTPGTGAEVPTSEPELLFPEDFEDTAKKIEEATAPEEQIRETLLAFQSLAKNPVWRNYLIKMVRLAKKAKGGDAEARKECLAFISEFLGGCADNSFIKPATAETVSKAFEKHFDLVLDAILANGGGK